MLKQTVTLAGLNIQFFFHNADTGLYFSRFSDKSATESDEENLQVPPVDFSDLRKESLRLNGDEAFAEYSLLIEPLANLLLRHGRFLFHGAAMIWHRKGFLFTGMSGVGKSTQLRHWMDLFPEETEVINGDKPIIELCDAGLVVHPSPWQGKENWGGRDTALLGGIILLERGKDDQICRISPKDAAYPVFLQFLYLPQEVNSVDLVCNYEEKMIMNVPVWKLTNTGTPESARLTHDYLISEGL